MGFEIVWTKKAVQTFEKRIAYLEQPWTEKEIYNFTKSVNDFLSLIQTQPYLFRKTNQFKNTHIGVIIK